MTQKFSEIFSRMITVYIPVYEAIIDEELC